MLTSGGAQTQWARGGASHAPPLLGRRGFNVQVFEYRDGLAVSLFMAQNIKDGCRYKFADIAAV